MNVSSSKFTISMITLVALVIGGSAYLNQEASAAVPTFVAIHNSTTTTEVLFYGNTLGVNGTAVLADWTVDGVVVTDITNGTAYARSATTAAYYGETANIGIFNRTLTIMLTHADVGTSEQSVIYTKTGNAGDIRSSPLLKGNDAFDQMATATVTGLDQVPPTLKSIKMIDAKRIQLTMTEPISNYNTTASDFTLNGASGAKIGSIIAANNTAAVATVGTADGAVIYLTTDRPMNYLDKYMTVTYSNFGEDVGDDQNIAVRNFGDGGKFMTDDTNSYKYSCRISCDEKSLSNIDGVGNRVANFTSGVIFNTLDSNGSTSSINTDKAPSVIASSVQVNNGFVEALVSTSPINVDVEVGDTVTFDFTITDENGAYTIPTISLYTNFIDRPDDMNRFYANNFDTVSQESTSYYEWHIRSDDVAYDYSNTVSWNDATYKVVDANTIETSFSFNVDNTMNPSEVWLQVGDTSYNFSNQKLPLTLDVTGDELLNFENTSNQKLLGFLNESVLSSIVSGWTTSNDDLANVVELSSALGVQDERLPSWTTNLANWVVSDEIHTADMIVAIEYIINQ